MIPYEIVRELCESASIDPSRVTHIEITPSVVRFILLDVVDGKPADVERKVRICEHRHPDEP